MVPVEKLRVDVRKTIRSVALPAEHGGWGFLLEPMLLGLLVAFSWPGVVLSLSMLAAFLLHQPLKIAVKDFRNQRRTTRTVYAEYFALGYGVVAVSALAVVVFNAEDRFLLPLLAALPLMMTQLFYDAANQSRALLPELAGASALGAIASALALLDGWEMRSALLLWLILPARSIPSILYVRARLRLERGRPISKIPAWTSHLVALLLIALLAAMQEIPGLVLLAVVMLLARALHGLSPYRRPAPRPVIIGVQEIIFGLLTVVIVAAAY